MKTKKKLTRPHRKLNKQSVKNISRFDYGKTAFQGWRVCLAYKGITFLKYVADATFQSRSSNVKKDRSFMMAQHILDWLKIKIQPFKDLNIDLNQQAIEEIRNGLKDWK